MRDNKGNRWEKYFNDYTVIDLETCGIIGDDRNSVIELSAIKIRDGVVVDEFSSLVNPMRPIPPLVRNLTGIDNAMVADAPLVQDILNNYLDFIGDDIVVGYNINSFDYNILYDLAESLYNRVFSNDFVDIFYAAKRSIRDVDNYRLTTVCSLYNIDYTGAHRALKDCHLTKAVYDRINDLFGNAAFDGQAYAVYSQGCSKRKEPHYSEETMQLKALQSILESIVEDKVVTETEVNSLVEWMEYNINLRGNYPFDRVFILLEKVLEDGVADDEELKMLLDTFTEYTNPTKSTCNGVGDLTDKHFVLTGEFSYGSRSAVSEYIVSKGGVVDDNVKKCTQYVVIGSLGSQTWKNGVYGSRIKKAMELKDKGQCIELVAEDDFFRIDNDDSMAQLNFFDANWMDIINEAIENIAKEEELPEGSLLLVENLSRDKQKVSSYSVAVLKPDYPRGVNPNGKVKNTLINIKNVAKKTNSADTLVVSIPDSILPMVRKLSKEYVDKYDSIIYIGGDVADSIELAGYFYKRLRDKNPKVHILAVLGNHEISEFSSLEEAVNCYAELFKSLRIDFLHNSVIGLEIGVYDFVQRVVCVGGIGFAPYNDAYNANNLVASLDIQFNRKREIEEGVRFLSVYNHAISIAVEHQVPLLVLTHYPIDDWLPNGKVNSQCFYFNGHNHANNYCFRNGAVVVADNQIGYDANSIQFKCYRVGTLQNPFYSYADGYYEICYKDYYSFYRYSGLMISSEGKSISKQIDKGFHFYMIKKNGFYMFVLIGEKDSWLCVGAQIKKIQGVSHIEYFYNAFDTIIQRYIQSFASAYIGLKTISEKLIKYGFNGRVHGFIIDLDFYNHIMFNPFDGKVTFYYSPVFGLVKEYPSINSLLCSIKDRIMPENYGSRNEYKREIKRLDKAISELKIEKLKLTGNETESVQEIENPSIKRVNVGHGSMYEHSKRMLQIQRLFECNILREWDMTLIEDLYIEEEFRPKVKPASDYMTVKNDWRNYARIDPKKRTKRVTLICFPILDSDYSIDSSGISLNIYRNRLFFPYIDTNVQASDDEISSFISSIPRELIKDTDVVIKLAGSLTSERFFLFFPKSELTTELIKRLIDFYWNSHSLNFPEDVMTYELWKYIYDVYGYSKRKTRVPNFPKDLWERIRSERKD